ncbi:MULTISPECIES: Fic family protein [Rhizobium]|uniref:Fic family protein n=1 Tax=Rhizobium TaxID=379 RepID=UPI0007E9E246|nr:MULTISPECIES: Fic/DOC family N-terminal domain-containing protein [Rhizobium]ANK90558.1 filamentation induced by cAMP/death on curing-related protein [Rhizobium sp. N6212]ANK96586.1 filamentation induced by cAMP/death on curing-related protein [Rhizobium sp. N621]ANL02628.1 filamentation induced by cAMP/death on curing-related protein [Rhizobium esperanzae]ANL08757.1 filamentation induced by cAMP/death on curing-related protein [Rhizobium sp. N1341]ANL20804.1 filamentation induced by cAMP/d
MVKHPNLDLSDAVEYHYDQFPPERIDANQLIMPIASASAALARYDQMLKGMHNSEILLAPLRNQEAVVSSRMEGTVSTLDEVLRYEADREEGGNEPEGHYRNEAIEVFLYSRALTAAQRSIEQAAPLSSFLIKSAHKVLLGFGRGAHLSPGEFKVEQNYLADRMRRKVHFVPMRPEQLNDGMERLFSFVEDRNWQILIKTAVAHLEFEALHPFKDGNGRIGRMLITLMLWKYGAISAPHFYISSYFEDRRDEYIDRMREVSKSGAWTEWVVFFLEALETQANKNLATAERIRDLYDELKREFPQILTSQWSTSALDFLFSRPVFRNNVFTSKSGIPEATAHRFTRILVEKELIRTLEPSAGRRPALYSFEPLLRIVRE